VTPLTAGQLEAALGHRDASGAWILNEDGTTDIVTAADIAPFLTPDVWPRYICRIDALKSVVSSCGVDAALDRIARPLARRLSDDEGAHIETCRASRAANAALDAILADQS